MAELKRINEEQEMNQMIKDRAFIPPLAKELLGRMQHDRHDALALDSAKVLTANMRYDKIVAKNNPYYNKKFGELPLTAYNLKDLEDWGQAIIGQESDSFDEKLVE